MQVPSLGCRVSATALALQLALAAGEARAEEPRAAVAEAPRHRLSWRYPKFRPIQIALATTTSVVELVSETVWRDGTSREWMAAVPAFDEHVRSALVARTPEGRARADLISDISWNVVQAAPVIDSLVVPLAFDHGNTEVALQLTLVNWQALSLSHAVTRVFHRTVGRGRPLVLGCEDDPQYDAKQCNGLEKTNVSFVSGHASMAFTAASLLCSHHLALPLYGERAADVGVCVVAMAGATATGVLRIVADKHWTTDVLAGAGLGLAIGFGIPYLFHYAYPRTTNGRSSLGPLIAVTPMASATEMGLAARGFF